jgi:SpoVK/Ycf46/Vps4 family AAA+-type ATPase
MSLHDVVSELTRLFDSGSGLVALSTFEEARARQAAGQAAAELGVPFFSWSMANGLDPAPGGHRSLSKVLDELRRSRPSGLFALFDLRSDLLNPLERRLLREVAAEGPLFKQYLLVISPLASVPEELQRESAMLVLPPPKAEDLERVLKETCEGLETSLSAEGAQSAVTAALGLGEEEARRAFRRALREGSEPARVVLEEKRRLLRRSAALDCIDLGDDEAAGLSLVGGLDQLKGWLSDRQRALGADARAFGLPPPKGLLLIGVQGCGKSLSAKAVAAQWRLPLARLDLAGLFAGEMAPEASLRHAVAAAEAMAPAVLWVDEIEKGFSGADSGRDPRLARIFGWFVTWLAERQSEVFVVATANEVSALPPELLRKGRFDEIFFVDLPDLKSRTEILAIHLKRRGREPGRLPVSAVAAQAEHFSGSELEQVVVSALHKAFAQKRQLSGEDLEQAVEETVPLYRTYEERIKALRDWAKDRARPAAADVKLVDYFQRT